MEGASGDLIPKMKELFGVTSFDLVFLDHWKDRYLPDTKLIEASLVVYLFKSKRSLFHDTLFCLLPVSGVRPPQERQHPAGGQRHLSRSSRILGLRAQQPSVREPVLQVSPGVHQSGGWPGEVRFPGVVLGTTFIQPCVHVYSLSSDLCCLGFTEWTQYNLFSKMCANLKLKVM